MSSSFLGCEMCFHVYNLDIFYIRGFFKIRVCFAEGGVGVLLDQIESKKSVAGAAQLLCVRWAAHCCICILGKFPSRKGLSSLWHRPPWEVVECPWIKKLLDVALGDTA